MTTMATTQSKEIISKRSGCAAKDFQRPPREIKRESLKYVKLQRLMSCPRLIELQLPGICKLVRRPLET
jgi:hypothetical protein